MKQKESTSDLVKLNLFDRFHTHIATNMIFIVVALPDFFLVEPSGCVEYFSYYYTVLWLQGVPDMYLQYAYESYFLFDLFKRRSKKLFGSCCPCCLLPKEFLYQIEHLLVLG